MPVSNIQSDPESTTESRNQLRQDFDRLLLQRPRPVSRRAQFTEGLTAPWVGLKFVIANKGYLRSFVVPIVVQTLISVGLIALLIVSAQLLSGWVQNAIMAIVQYFRPDSVDEDLSRWATIAIYVAIGCLLLYVFRLVWRVTGGIVGDYFGDRITNQVMTDLGIETTQPANSMARTVFNTTKMMVLSHVVMLVCSPLSALPVVGTLVVLTAGSTAMLFLKGTDELSDPLISLGLTQEQAVQLSKRHKWTAMGLAASKAGLEPVPVLGGAISAAESIGRISVAMRLLELDRAETV